MKLNNLKQLLLLHGGLVMNKLNSVQWEFDPGARKGLLNELN